MPLYNNWKFINNNNNNIYIYYAQHINNLVKIYKLYPIQDKYINYKRHLHFREYYI